VHRCIIKNKELFNGSIDGWYLRNKRKDVDGRSIFPLQDVRAAMISNEDHVDEYVWARHLLLRKMRTNDDAGAFKRHPDVKNATWGGRFHFLFSVEHGEVASMIPNGHAASEVAINQWRSIEDKDYDGRELLKVCKKTNDFERILFFWDFFLLRLFLSRTRFVAT